ncbi:hypothetical protein DYB36_013674 [Aphanomyces astaci]|uniref:Uncharacterized protein n=1 Tax=Aphanomyces astaci TaxID=112090 RepID=A0A396ZX45_APHAT|nr:hypothetical protein DYB36_013674 [Aphanomyces astaci]
MDPAVAELNWAIHAKAHARSRLAFKVFVKIIADDDGTRDDIVYQAYLEMEFLTFHAARATAVQMLTRFHGAHEPYLLKSRAEAKLYKLDDAFLSAFVGLGFCPIHTALLRSTLHLYDERYADLSCAKGCPPISCSGCWAWSLNPRTTLCMSTAFLRGFYEPTTADQTTLFERDCGIILSRAVRKLESVPVVPGSVFVFDVDDTAVTSYWYMKERGFKAIPATEFYYYARYHAPVIPLLFKFYTLIMRLPHEQMLSVAKLKQNMRTTLHREHHKVIGCIGDQFCDITGEFTGSPFKIPNYMYQVE